MPGRMLFRYTREEVAKHNTPSDLWVINNNKVYEMTEFVLDHPGGADLLKEWGGKDVTEIMSDPASHRHSQVAYEVLVELCIGEIVETNTATSDTTIETTTIRPLSTLTNNDSPLASEETPSAHNDTREENGKIIEDRPTEEFHITNTDINSDLQQEKFLDLNKPLFNQMLNCTFSKEFYLTQIHKPRHLNVSAVLFEHPYLELLTRTPWYIVPIVWLPIIYYHLNLASETLGNKSITILFILGVGLWTLIEYGLHRFLFHVDKLLPDHPYALLIHFTLHGIHHYLPMDRLRLVMPPVLAFMIATPIIRFGHMIFPVSVAQGLSAGAMFGYVCYDLTHYHLHHSRPLGHHLRQMKTYHLSHHYKNFELGYGITSKFWDRYFGTELLLGTHDRNL